MPARHQLAVHTSLFTTVGSFVTTGCARMERCTRCFRAASTQSAPLSEYEQSPDHRVGRSTPLHDACDSGDLARVRSLLRDGADPWARDGAGLAPIKTGKGAKGFVSRQDARGGPDVGGARLSMGRASMGSQAAIV